jgi:calcineurin-like phosphoesterase
MEQAVAKMREETKVIFVDMHCETTSEKYALAWHLDGRVSAIVGTHTHVQTADERIFPNGSAFLCDAGMCGPLDSCIGMQVDLAVQRFISLLPSKHHVARGPVKVCGVLIDVEAHTGRALRIQRIQRIHQGD